MAVSLETPRLLIRPWSVDDAEALFKYASDGRVSELALWPTHTSLEMSREVIEKFFIPNTDTFAIVLKSSDEAIGCIGLVPEGDEHYPVGESEREVGYWVGYPYWNKGLTSEALKAMVNHYDGLDILRSLLITTDAKNTASRRVAEKCGFVKIADYDNEGCPSFAFRLQLR